MKTGGFMESLVDRFVPSLLCLSLFIHLCLAAPGLPGTEREESANANATSGTLTNPFGSGEEDRRLLKHFVQSNLKEGQDGQEFNTWEQEVFFLFRLYDFDRSGLLDGLEMMKMVSDYNSHHTPGEPANEKVVSMVDFLLQTQDLNQDGLLAPSELLSPSLPHTQDSDQPPAPHQEGAPEEKLTGAAEEHKDQAAEQQTQDHQQQQVKTEGEVETLKQEDGSHEQQHIPEAPAAAQEQHHEVPVHQGQPEM